MEFATGSERPFLRLDWFARIFADVSLLESQATGKSEKDDINERPGWT